MQSKKKKVTWYYYLFNFRTCLTTNTKWFDLKIYHQLLFEKLMKRKENNKLTIELIAEFKAMPPTTLQQRGSLRWIDKDPIIISATPNLCLPTLYKSQTSTNPKHLMITFILFSIFKCFLFCFYKTKKNEIKKLCLKEISHFSS